MKVVGSHGRLYDPRCNDSIFSVSVFARFTLQYVAKKGQVHFGVESAVFLETSSMLYQPTKLHEVVPPPNKKTNGWNLKMMGF